MNELLRHRGPDDEGVWADPATGVALGSRRLSIIDVPGGHQPLTNEDGTVVAVFNGEIYNHRDLRADLRRRGHRFATATDTEVLVHLYEEFGCDLVHALEGMFAFALWDTEREALLLARDRFGEKPLFYAERGGHLTFASELSAVMAGGPIERDIDPESVDAFFVFGYVPGPRTIVRGAQELRPGHVLTWQRSNRTCAARRYWAPPIPERTPSEPLAELTAEAKRLLERSVQSRLVADVPVGVFLSGGVDSTLVAACAAQLAPGAIRTYTVGYDVGNVDERAAAAAVAHRLGAEHREMVLTEAAVARRAPELLAALDQPLADRALLPLHVVAEFARREVKVAVGGEGGDEIFGGYPRYRWLPRASWIGEAIPRPVAARTLGVLAGAAPGSPLQRVGERLGRAAYVARSVDWVTGGRRRERPRLYGPRLRAQAGNEDFLREAVGYFDEAPNAPVPARLMHLDQMHWLPYDVLVKSDRASMLVGLEVRSVYLQRELAEFAATVSADAHLRAGGKALLRRTLGEILPRRRTRRPKIAFRVPAAEWLRGALEPTLRAQLRTGSLYRDGWIDRGYATRLVDQHVAGHRDWTDVLWPILALGLWLDRFQGADGA